MSGINTENRPSSETKEAHPPLLTTAGGAGVLLGVLLGVLGGRAVCSWALSEKLIPIVIMANAKNLFILDVPSRS